MPPTINVLWSDPWQESRPEAPTGLSPRETTASFAPVFSGSYDDADGHDGMLVFFGYLPATGAFAGAAVSAQVPSGATATASGYLPLDFPLEWRAMAVDLTEEVPSSLSAPIPLVHPSVRVTEPFAGDSFSGSVTLSAELDPSITDATGVELRVDGAVVASASTAPFTVAWDSNAVADGDHTITAKILGGAAAGRTSEPVTLTVANTTDPPPEASFAEGTSPAPVLRRTLRADDDHGDPLGVAPAWSATGDCGYSEALPDGKVLWLVCDGFGRSSAAGLAAGSTPTQPTWLNAQFVPLDPALSCPAFDVPDDGTHDLIADRPVSWMTGVTSIPIPDAAPGDPDTAVVVSFLRACAIRVLLGDISHREWDPGTAGIAMWYHTSGQNDLAPATVLSYNTWIGRWGANQPGDEINVLHGDGIVYSPQGGGRIYAYACKPGILPIPAYGRCTVARATATPATVSTLGQRASWSYWNGTGWTACAGSCSQAQLRDAEGHERDMTVPTPELQRQAGPATCPDGKVRNRCFHPWYVPQHFQVVYSEQLQAFIAANQRYVWDQDGHQMLRARLATRPQGPWSQPVDIPIRCRVPRTALTCYQIGAHPELTGADGTSTTFHYYDAYELFTDDLDDRQLDSISFIDVPLCAVDLAYDEGPSAHVNFVVGRCYLTDPGTATAWTTDPIGRLETAALLWRLRGYRARNTGLPQSVPAAHREAVAEFLDTPGFAAVWPNAGAFVPDTAATRGELIELLWQEAGHPPATWPTNHPSDWSSIDDDLKPALRWAYSTGVTCAGLGGAGSFDPGGTALRVVAAKWVRRAQSPAACTASEGV